MKKILLVGLLGLTFFESLESAQAGNSSILKFIAYTLTSKDSSVAQVVKGAGFLYNTSELMHGHRSFNVPKIKSKDSAQSISSAVMVTPSVLEANPRIVPYVATTGMLKFMKSVKGPAVSSKSINQYMVKSFVDENPKFFYEFYRSGMFKISDESPTSLASSELTSSEKKGIVKTLLPLYENYSALDQAVNKISSTTNPQVALRSIQSEVAKLPRAIDRIEAEAILNSAFAYQQLMQEAQADSGSVVRMKLDDNVDVLATKSEVPGLKIAMNKYLTDKDETLQIMASAVGIENPVTSINQFVAEVTENREAIEEVKGQAENILQKNPNASVEDVFADLLSDGLSASVPTSLVNQSLTDGFLEGVRGICMSKALELIGKGSNDQVMKMFEQTVLNREAGYNKEEQAYMLGYFQGCLWQLRKDSNYPSDYSDESLLKIVEVTKQLNNRYQNNFRG